MSLEREIKEVIGNLRAGLTEQARLEAKTVVWPDPQSPDHQRWAMDLLLLQEVKRSVDEGLTRLDKLDRRAALVAKYALEAHLG